MVQLLKVHEKIFITKVLQLARQTPVIQTIINLRCNTNCQIYVDISTQNNTSGNIDEFVYWNIKRNVSVEEIDQIARVMTVFFSASLDITVVFRPYRCGNSGHIPECFCVICYYLFILYIYIYIYIYILFISIIIQT